MPKYSVESPLKYDGDDYGEGDVVDMPAKDAEPLLELGVLGETKKADAPKAPDKIKPETEAALHAAIHDAVSSLDQADTTLWSKDGNTAKVDAISNVLGFTVTAAERDAAVPVQAAE